MIETRSTSNNCELPIPGPNASPEEWKAYLDAYNPMDRGKPQGKKVDVYGDWVKPESEERKEDTNKYHGLTCPINLRGTLVGPHIDQPNERPVEREVFGEEGYDD